MDAELKKKWVAALRSGEYTQGTGWLHMGDKYCCIGVLCALMGRTDYTDENGLILVKESQDAGLGRDPDEPGFPSVAHLLADMNDNGGTFAEIADYIEANL